MIELFDMFCTEWEQLKQEAVATNDYTMYIFFLKESKKRFSVIYASMEEETHSAQALVEEVLKLVSCELLEISIKYKESKLPF